MTCEFCQAEAVMMWPTCGAGHVPICLKCAERLSQAETCGNPSAVPDDHLDEDCEL